MVFMTAEGIGLAVVGYINQQIQIRTADRFQNNALGFAAVYAGYDLHGHHGGSAGQRR